jgi:hypothetical protein
MIERRELIARIEVLLPYCHERSASKSKVLQKNKII